MEEPLAFDPIEEAARQWRERWGEEQVPAMRAVTSIMRAQQILIARLNAALEPHGITFARYEALMLLYFSREGALPLGKIGARLQVHRTSVTNVIDGLEASGLVARSAHPTDRRAILATITERGRAIAKEATETLHELRFGTGPLTAEQLAELTRTLRSLRLAAGDFLDE